MSDRRTRVLDRHLRRSLPPGPDRRHLRLLLTLALFATLALAALVGPSSALAGLVSGRVTDAVTGDPIAWATVHAQDSNGVWGGYVYTDDTGAYAMAMGPGECKLSCIADFHVTQYYNDEPDFASADTITVGDTNVDGVDFVMQRSPQAHFQGTVFDGTTGDPVSRVQVTACTLGDDGLVASDYYTTTASDGTYDLTVPPGTYALRYYCAGSYDEVYYPNAASGSDATFMAVNDGDVKTGVDATLTREPVTLTAWAQDIDGAWLPGIEIQVLSASDGHVIRSATTGADGTCVIDLSDLLGQQVKFCQHDPSGEFADQYYNTLSTGAPTFAQAVTVTPTLGGLYYCETHLYNQSPGEIKGRTLDAKGDPVGGIPVWLSCVTSTNYSVQTVSDASGDYDFPGLHVSRATSFLVEFDATDYFGTYLPQYYNGKFTATDATRVSLAPGQTLTLDSSLYKRCRVGGVVTDANGPVKEIAVTLYDQGDNVVSTQTTPSNGAYLFTDLQPGDYRIGYHDQSTVDPNALPVYHDQFSGGAATLDAATPIHLDGIDTATVTANVQLVPWGGILAQVDSSLEPYGQLSDVDVTLYNSWGEPLATSDGLNDEGGSVSYGYLFKYLDYGTYYLGVNDPGDAYFPVFFDNAATLAKATKIVLTAAASKSTPTIYVTPVRGVAPDTGALPDGSTTVPSVHLGIKAAAIASDGATTLIGGHGAGSQSGTYVYGLGDAGWAQLQLLDVPGDAVAVDGDVAVATVAGGLAADDPGVGRAYVYRRIAGVWTLEANLGPDDGDHGGGFGDSVALSGDTLLVGAPYAYSDTSSRAGAAYVFVHQADGSWSQQAKITPGTGSGAAFGLHVALDGDRALVSRGGTDGTDGSVAVFERSGTTWQQTGQLVAGDPGPTTLYGAALALQGDTALVGDPGQFGDTGAAFVFQKSSSGWSQTARLAAADGQPDDQFGASLALQGDEALVGAPDRGITVTGTRSGSAYLFRLEDGVWYQDTDMEPAAATPASCYGDAVALAGRDLFVGAPGELRSNGVAGRVEIYSPYVTDRDVPLVVDASRGLLINDCSPEGGALTVGSNTQPAHGGVVVNADGSFTYTPTPGFVGTDQFTYQALGLSGWLSGATTVTLTVRDTSDPTLGTSGVPTGWVHVAPSVTLSAHDDTSVSATEYRVAANALWRAYGAPIKVTSQGVSTYGVRSRDVFGNATVGSFVVKLDTRRPTPKARYAATVRRGGYCGLRYEIADPTPGSPTATVKIVIVNARGRQVWATTRGSRRVNKNLICSFRCELARGAYHFWVYATDAAGNVQTRAASNRLTVK